MINTTVLEQFDYSKKLLQAVSVYVIYRGKEGSSNVVALRGLNLEVERGDFIAIVGPSGSGKSSLLRCIGGLQHPSAGAIYYHGIDITKLNEHELVPFRREMVGFVFQEGNLLESITGYQNVVKTLRYAGKSYSEARERATEVLSQLGLKSRMHDLPKKLSGGERQRVAIARALANKPRFILADEPTGNIDYENTENVMGIFRDLHRELETSFMLVTHSQHVAGYADRKLELRDGRFTGEHAEAFDLDELSRTRSVIIESNGSMNLPPSITTLLEDYGNLWNFRMEIKKGIPNIIGQPAELSNEYLENCPVCKKELKADTVFCQNCGAKVKNIE